MPSSPARSPARKALLIASAGIAMLLLGILVGRWLAGAL